MDIRKKKAISILEYILEDLNMNGKQLSESLGFKTPERIYKVLRGDVGISKGFATKLNDKYPKYSLDWLLGGDADAPNLSGDGPNYLVLSDKIFDNSERLAVLLNFISENHERLMANPIYKVYITRIKEEFKKDLVKSESEKKRQKFKDQTRGKN